jgi:hypothetical protein
MLPQRSRLGRQPWDTPSRLWDTLEWRLVCWFLLPDRAGIAPIAIGGVLVVICILCALTAAIA